jgi:phosphonate transport system substrate-binding protein
MKKILVLLTAFFTLLIFGNSLYADITLGLIPAEKKEEMLKEFEPLRQYLEKTTGEKVKLFTTSDYAGVIEAMKNKMVDIAWFGPLSYVLAEQEAGAEVFAVGVRKNGSSTYKSCIVVPGDSPAKSIMDLKGKHVAFVDPASTSGGLVPVYMVKKATGMMPEKFFGKFEYLGKHDIVELAVKNKTVDAGADNDLSYEKMIEKGEITKESNKILVYSDPLPGSPISYRKDLDPKVKEKVKSAILSAHKNMEKVSGFGQIIRYDVAKPEDYQMIRDLIKELGLQKSDMLK